MTKLDLIKLLVAFLISTVAILLFWYLTLTFGWTVAIYATKSVLVAIILTLLMQLFMR